jgi:DNA adenine methylase
MKYMGSKNRHANEILSIVLKNRKPGQWYVEPFVGGANLIDKVSGNRMGADIDADLILMWDAVSKGWIPPQVITEDDYMRLRNDCEMMIPLRGYAAFALSYGGKKWGGWCRDSLNKRNYVDESYRSALLQFPKLKDVIFKCCSYDQLQIPDQSIIYCDPPYFNTTKYKHSFDHSKFWEWVRIKTIEGHSVYVSEYNAPDDFVCVWQKEVNSSLTKNTGAKKTTEKLFRYNVWHLPHTDRTGV